jgi:tRNA-specific adenosine deaminase 1
MWGHGYKFHQIRVGVTGREFKFSRRGGEGVDSAGKGKEVGKFVSSNVAMSWMRGDGKTGGETLVNGCLQGRKLFDIRGASRICRKRTWGLGVQVMKALSGAAVAGVFENAGVVDGMVIEKISKCLMAENYRDLKDSEILEERRKVKEEARGCLGGWVRNEGDDEFGLE